MTLMGWSNPSRKKPTGEKLQEAIDCYRRKHRADPAVCLTSLVDAAELGPDTEIPVRGVPHIQRYVFYVGTEDGQ